MRIAPCGRRGRRRRTSLAMMSRRQLLLDMEWVGGAEDAVGWDKEGGLLWDEVVFVAVSRRFRAAGACQDFLSQSLFPLSVVSHSRSQPLQLHLGQPDADKRVHVITTRQGHACDMH